MQGGVKKEICNYLLWSLVLILTRLKTEKVNLNYLKSS